MDLIECKIKNLCKPARKSSITAMQYRYQLYHFPLQTSIRNTYITDFFEVASKVELKSIYGTWFMNNQ